MEILEKLHFPSSYRSELVRHPERVGPRPVKVLWKAGDVPLQALTQLPRALWAGLHEIERGRLFALVMADGEMMLSWGARADVLAVEPATSLELNAAQQERCLRSRKFLATETCRQSLIAALGQGEVSRVCPPCTVVLLEGLTPDCMVLWPFVPAVVAEAFDSATGFAWVTPELDQLIAMLSSPFCQTVQVDTPYELLGGDSPS